MKLQLCLLMSSAVAVLATDHPDCANRANYCGANEWMMANCKTLCANAKAKDSCGAWKSFCGKGFDWMQEHCKGTCSADYDDHEFDQCLSNDFQDPTPDPNLVAEVPGAGYAIKQMQPNVWAIYAASYNSLLVTGTDHAMLIDIGHGAPDKILAAVKSVLGTSPLTHFFYGHSHHDHVGGADKVKEMYPKCVFIASTATAEVLATLDSPSRPPAELVLTDISKGLQVGGVDYQFTPLVGHGTDNVVVMVDGKTAFCADVINPGSAPFLNFAFANNFNLKLFKKDLETLRDLPWTIFIPGHNNRPGTREDIRVVLLYTDAVIKAAMSAMGSVDYGGAMSKHGLSMANAYGFPGYRVFYEEVAKACEADINKQWKSGTEEWTPTNIRAVDGMSFSHCWAAAWYNHMYAPGR